MLSFGGCQLDTELVSNIISHLRVGRWRDIRLEEQVCHKSLLQAYPPVGEQRLGLWDARGVSPGTPHVDTASSIPKRR